MSILEKALRLTILGGIFALPFIGFIVATPLFFPYITGKNFAFRIIVEVISGAWLALALVYPAYRPRRSWLLVVFAFFVFVIAIADLQGVYPFKSFWSNYERMDGWVTLIHLLFLLAVASTVLRAEKLWRRLWEVSLAASVVIAVYGFLQIAGQLALGGGGTSGWMARIDATFGNPIYLAVYMLFHIFIAAFLWVRMRSEKTPAAHLPYSFWYGTAIAVDTLALFFTGTRGTMLGLIGGGLLALFVYSFTASATKRVRHWVVGAIVAVVALGGGLWLARDTAFVHSIGFLDRLASISLSDNTTKARLLNMSIAWHGVVERPVFGWGQENYAIVFDKYYDPRMYAQEPWFDRVHDVIFDWWIAGGTIGLLAYLSIFAAAIWALWRRTSDFSNAERSIFTGLLGGYFFHNLFVFDNITSYILFALVLAYLVWRSTSDEHFDACNREVLPSAALPFVTVLSIVLIIGVAWYTNWNALVANRTLIRALSKQESGVTQNLTLYKQAISYQAYGTQEAREQLSQVATQVAAASGLDVGTKQQFFSLATSEMMLQAEASPLDARFPLFLGIVEDAYGDYADAAVALQKAHELSPQKQSILFQVALNKQAMGDEAGALATLKQAYDLAPSYNDARLFYAAQAIRMGNDTLADELLKPLVPTGEAADARIATAYAGRKAYGKIVPIWQAHVQASPQDAQGYFTLAAAYVGAGDPGSAIATLQAVARAVPSTAAQAEAFMSQVRNGTAAVQ